VRLGTCHAIVTFEFTHTESFAPGPVNRYLAHTALELWHGPVGERRSVPILAPARMARALREAEGLRPSTGAPQPRIVEFEVADEYRRLVECRTTDGRHYALGVAASICRALLRCRVAVGDVGESEYKCGSHNRQPLFLAIVTHIDHAPRWAATLEPMLRCQVALPQPKSPADFQLWGLDEDGYWGGSENPQVWTRSAEAFRSYERDRLEAFTIIAGAAGPLWRQRSWEWLLPPRLYPGRDVWALSGGEWHWAVIASDSEDDGDCGSDRGGSGFYVCWVRDASGGMAGRSRWRWRPENLQEMRDEDVVHASDTLSSAAEDSNRNQEEEPTFDTVFISDLPPHTTAKEVSEALCGFGRLCRVHVKAAMPASLVPSGSSTCGRGPDRWHAWAVFEDSESAERACCAAAGYGPATPKVAGCQIRIGRHRRGQHWSRWRHSVTPGWRMQRCSGCEFAVTGVLPQFCCWRCKEANGQHGPACRRMLWRPLHRPRSLSC